MRYFLSSSESTQSPTARFGGGDRFHHTTGFFKLLEQLVDFLNAGSATGSDALATAGVDDVGVAAFFRGHGTNDGFHAIKGIVVNVHVFDSLAGTGNHGHQILDITHLFDLGNLADKVVEVELVLGNLFGEFPGFFLVELLLGFFHQRDDVTHAEDTVSHASGIKGVDSLRLFTRTNKLDGLVDHRPDRQGSTTTGITIEFGQHHAVEIEAVVEFLGGIDSILTGHGIDHE